MKAASSVNSLQIVLKRATLNLDFEVDVHNLNFLESFIASFLKLNFVW